MPNYSCCKSETSLKLLAEIEKMEIIDAHEHLPSEDDRLKQDVDALTMFSHYCKGDLRAAGMAGDEFDFVFSSAPVAQRWEKFKPYYERIKNTAYVKAAHIAMEKFYGESVLTDANVEKVSADIKAANQPGLYKKVLKDTCNISTCLNQNSDKSDDGFLTPIYWQVGDASNHRGLKRLSEKLGREIQSVDDVAETAEVHINEIVSKGGVGYKIFIFPMQKPDLNNAKESLAYLLANKDDHSIARSCLSDFYYDAILKQLEKHGLVACLHTGYWGDFRGLHPAYAMFMADHYPNVNFDLYHVGYPYVREAIMLGKAKANIYMNLCWTYIISPHFAEDALTEMIEMVPSHKILGFGGDYCVVEKIYGHLVMARQIIANVLARKVDEGWFTFEEVVGMAHKMLYANPKELYKL